VVRRIYIWRDARFGLFLFYFLQACAHAAPPAGAHHLDLMFSHENDPDTVKEARREELANIRSWIADFHAHRTAAA